MDMRQLGRGPGATLPGPAREITVEPVKAPQEEPLPVEAPEREPAPAPAEPVKEPEKAPA